MAGLQVYATSLRVRASSVAAKRYGFMTEPDRFRRGPPRPPKTHIPYLETYLAIVRETRTTCFIVKTTKSN